MIELEWNGEVGTDTDTDSKDEDAMRIPVDSAG
jgi:hypothetical protein